MRELTADAIFLSPHFDDVPLSCGGTVALFAASGRKPVILTLFGGEPSEPLSFFAQQQHRWRGMDDRTAVQLRREEERAAAGELGATAHWFDVPDAIYRDARYNSDDELFGPLHPDDLVLVDKLLDLVEGVIRSRAESPAIFVPLAHGNHVDHQIARLLGTRLVERGFSVWAYEDQPYSAMPGSQAERDCTIQRWTAGPPWLVFLSEELFQRRLRAISQYRSQIAFVFRDLGPFDRVLRSYTLEAGRGQLAERFWELQPLSTVERAPEQPRGELS